MRTEIPRRTGLGEVKYIEGSDILREPLENADYESEAVDATLTEDPEDAAIPVPELAFAVSIKVIGGAARYKFVPIDGDVPAAGDMLHYMAAGERMEFRVSAWGTIYMMMDDALTPTEARVSFLG